MQVSINNQSCEVPFDLAAITLGDFIAYQDEYGADLDKLLIEITQKEHEGDEEDIELQKLVDFDSHLDMEALAWFSFWTKSDLFEVKDQPFITPVLEQYRLLRNIIKEQMQDAEILFPLEISWNNELWSIQDFKVNPASEMSFNEIITSKETMRQLDSLGKGQWQALIYLCAIYFRKKDEAFEDEMVFEEGERMTLLKTLPLNIAIKVSFFLNSCVSIWKKISVFSVEAAEVSSLN